MRKSITEQRAKLSNSKSKAKIRKTVAFDRADYDYLKTEMDSGRFYNINHAVKAGITLLRKEEELKLIIADYRRIIDENRRIIEELKKQASH